MHDRSLVDSAVEEFLRYASLVLYLRRNALEPMEVAGQSIEPGDLVSLWYAAANPDPAVFADPDPTSGIQLPAWHQAPARPPRARLTAMAVHRNGDERVTRLELFFDLVFVLAVTQCTAFLAADPTWSGVGKGLLVLAALWWGWVGYAWLTGGVIVAAVTAIGLCAAMWWAYFDVVALVALGLKATLAHVDEPLDLVPAAALVGGVGVYLLAHVAFRLRNIGTINPQRLALGLLLFALVPVAREVDALVALAGVTALLWVMIAYEATHFATARDAVRHGDYADPPSR